jgi:START domain
VKAGILHLLFFTLGTTLLAQDKWTFKREKDGIKIFSRSSKLSRFDDLKIEMDLTGNVNQLASILLDVEKYTQWAYGTKSSVVVKKISNSELIYYSEIGVPWPASNRDFYANFKVMVDTPARSLKVVSSGMKNYKPEKANLVRIPMSKGVWVANTLSDKKIHLVYILELDPGGSVPAWVLNIFATKGPMQTFENLQHRMIMMNQ